MSSSGQSDIKKSLLTAFSRKTISISVKITINQIKKIILHFSSLFSSLFFFFFCFNTSLPPFVPPLPLNSVTNLRSFDIFRSQWVPVNLHVSRIIGTTSFLLIFSFYLCLCFLALRSGYTELGHVYENQTACKRINIPIKTLIRF